MASRTSDPGGEDGCDRDMRPSVAVQTEGKLVLLEGLTVTLHAREDSEEDLVIKAALNGEEQQEETGTKYGWLG